jgi:hypothetical protein
VAFSKRRRGHRSRCFAVYRPMSPSSTHRRNGHIGDSGCR